jgi:hypothetical protein
VDDFVGRTFDCWAVIQHLERRRLVVVSAEPGADSGLGLTAVCDAATRYLQLRSFGAGSGKGGSFNPNTNSFNATGQAINGIGIGSAQCAPCQVKGLGINTSLFQKVVRVYLSKEQT